MKLIPKKGNGGHITSYFVIIGSKEARDAGFLLEDGSAVPLKKVVDAQQGTITISRDIDASDVEPQKHQEP